jgi:hypothetical protein
MRSQFRETSLLLYRIFIGSRSCCRSKSLRSTNLSQTLTSSTKRSARTTRIPTWARSLLQKRLRTYPQNNDLLKRTLWRATTKTFRFSCFLRSSTCTTCRLTRKRWHARDSTRTGSSWVLFATQSLCSSLTPNPRNYSSTMKCALTRASFHWQFSTTPSLCVASLMATLTR